MKNGVPFHLVLEDPGKLTDVECAAFAIVFSEMEGSKFNWRTMEFEERGA